MPPATTRERRNRSIRRAISTSLGSKLTTAILQFVSLPIAARILGKEEFGIYATVSLAVLSVIALQLGVGPALARGISEAHAKSDSRAEARLYFNGGVLVIALAAISLAIVAAILLVLPIPVLFGEKYAAWERVMIPALWIGAALTVAQIVVGHTDRVLEGYMEASVVNAWNAGGNLLAAVVLVAGIHSFPSVTFLLLAVFVPNILARAVSTVFLLRKRPHLKLQLSSWDKTTLLELLKDGTSFSATASVVRIVEVNVCALLVGRFLGPGEVAVFQVLIFIMVAFTGQVMMVGTPLWAAIVNAKADADYHWIRSAARRYYLFLGLIALTATGGLVLLGPSLLPLWFGEEFVADRMVFAGFSLFLVAVGWRQVNRYLSIGLGKLHQTISSILWGTVIGLLLGTAGLMTAGMGALFAGMALGILILPGRKLPQLVWTEVRELAA
ncbi:MAG: lipopolysaccharide biosynthesis protein [Verrucomicrobiota bacterium]